ncbi:MAG: hypothetical protein H0U27_09435 [Nitrosopumilus sp.]|nr:hypothetical protein [Nitrosopumilus sp.]
MSNINSLEHRLYNVDFSNLKELEIIKADAKSQLEADSSLSLEQTTLILNTIMVLNEVIMNTTSQLPETEPNLKRFYDNALLTSVSFFSNVPSEDKDQLINGFNQSMQTVDALWKGLVEGDAKQKAEQTLEDLRIYGTSCLTAKADVAEDISVSLKKLDPTIEMIRTTGDGNCFYNAISTTNWILNNQGQQLGNDKHEDEHGELRQKTTEHMKKLNVPASQVAKHSENGYWATESQIQYLAGAADEKPILVLAQHPNKKDELVGSLYLKKGLAVVDPSKLRVIVNIDNVHFNALNTTLEARKILIKLYEERIIPAE